MSAGNAGDTGAIRQRKIYRRKALAKYGLTIGNKTGHNPRNRHAQCGGVTVGKSWFAYKATNG